MVLGVFLGLLITILACSFCVNIHTLNHFTVTSDTSKMPRKFREKIYNRGYDYNTISNVVGYVLCAFGLYIAV